MTNKKQVIFFAAMLLLSTGLYGQPAEPDAQVSGQTIHPQDRQQSQDRPQSQTRVPERMLSPAWEELTSGDFALAVERAGGVCIIPMGVIEKHAQHLPLGTDVFAARHIALTAAAGEYAVVFPFYFAGQIFEARHQPGTVSYSPQMLYDLLDETCREIARNGFTKIILMNGHGGNNNFLQYFCQTQLASARDYAVFFFNPSEDRETARQIAALRKSTTGGHADEVETSVLLVVRPDLVHMGRVALDSGADQNRLPLPGAYTGIWWYARFPNHYAGDALGANPEIGRLSIDSDVAQLRDVIRLIKADTATRQLQDQFFRSAGSFRDGSKNKTK